MCFCSCLVIDVPSRDYLPDLQRNELLNGHIDEINSNIGMEFVAHFTSSDIIETPEYQQFMRRINAKRHLAINDTNMYVSQFLCIGFHGSSAFETIKKSKISFGFRSK